MYITKKLKEIEEHFNSVSKEKLEKNLIKAGSGVIQSSSSSNMKMLTEEELEDVKYTYSKSQNNYNFENLPNMDYREIEVA